MTVRLSIRFWQLESSAQRCEVFGKCHVRWRLEAGSIIDVRASRGGGAGRLSATMTVERIHCQCSHTHGQLESPANKQARSCRNGDHVVDRRPHQMLHHFRWAARARLIARRMSRGSLSMRTIPADSTGTSARQLVASKSDQSDLRVSESLHACSPEAEYGIAREGFPVNMVYRLAAARIDSTRSAADAPSSDRP